MAVCFNIVIFDEYNQSFLRQAPVTGACLFSPWKLGRRRAWNVRRPVFVSYRPNQLVDVVFIAAEGLVGYMYAAPRDHPYIPRI